MHIAILGCGNLGSSLGQIWARLGHQVTFASSQPHKARELAQAVGGQWASYPEAIANNPVLLYTLRQVLPQRLTSTGWQGKTVIDTNLPDLPIAFRFQPRSQSLAQQLALQLPLCQVVKAFCLHPAELYHHGPEALRQWGVQSFYCGDSPADKAKVEQLLLELGLLPFDCGGLERAHLLEGLGDFWRLFQLQQGQALVSQFQLIGYPEPSQWQRRPSYCPEADESEQGR